MLYDKPIPQPQNSTPITKMNSISDLRCATEAPSRGIAWFCLAPVLSLLATVTAANTPAVLQCLEADRKKPDATIVVTDLEPDDRFALHVLAHNLDAGELDLDSGYAVTIEGNDNGHVAVVDSVNVDLFRRRMIESLSRFTAR